MLKLIRGVEIRDLLELRVVRLLFLLLRDLRGRGGMGWLVLSVEGEWRKSLFVASLTKIVPHRSKLKCDRSGLFFERRLNSLTYTTSAELYLVRRASDEGAPLFAHMVWILTVSV